MKDGQVIKPGTVVFSSGSPCGDGWYGVIVDRNFWLENSKKEDMENAQDFLKLEKSNFQVIPILVLGSFTERVVLGYKYVKCWVYASQKSHVSFILNPEDLRKFLSHSFHFHGSRYLREVFSELKILIDYLENPHLTKERGDADFQMWNLFQKAIPR